MNEYTRLGIGTMKSTLTIIQLADRTIKYPKGIVEDVLVQVKDFIFPVDFYIIDMDPDLPSSQTDVVLGRPFLRTARAMIDCYDGSIELAFCGEKLKFKISDSMRFPQESHSVNFIDVTQTIMKEIAETIKDPLEVVLSRNIANTALSDDSAQGWKTKEFRDVLSELDKGKTPTRGMLLKTLDHNTPVNFPSVLQPPELELETIPARKITSTNLSDDSIHAWEKKEFRDVVTNLDKGKTQIAGM